MGELAEYILNGDDCQECGQYIGDGDGFPRSCSDCKPQQKQEMPTHLYMMRDTDTFEAGHSEFIACREGKEGLTHYVKADEVTPLVEQAKVDIGFLKEDRARYAAYHQTEKTMRENAEADLSKFKKIFGRIYWKKG